ncbi:MAG: hypothetical protein WBF93_15930 [Pirellulales bacterium]
MVVRSEIFAVGGMSPLDFIRIGTWTGPPRTPWHDPRRKDLDSPSARHLSLEQITFIRGCGILPQ